MIRVLLADDHQMVRAGLSGLLEASNQITVAASVADGAAAVTAFSEFNPDVVLMDLSMPVMDGITATKEITSANPLARIVILTSYNDQNRVDAALNAGAIGYVLKDAEPSALVASVLAAAAGGSPLDPRVASGLLAIRREKSAPELTAREREVLILVGRGMLNKQIARQLNISEKTVKAHLGKVFQRIGVTDRTQAALWAQRNGLLPEG